LRRVRAAAGATRQALARGVADTGAQRGARWPAVRRAAVPSRAGWPQAATVGGGLPQAGLSLAGPPAGVAPAGVAAGGEWHSAAAQNRASIRHGQTSLWRSN